MRWLLRLFSLFRSMEFDLTACREAVEELTAEKSHLEDRLDAALSDKEQLWQAMQGALDNERYALRSQVNHAVQRAGGGIPYPDAHNLPATAVRPPQEPGPVGRSGRMMASEAMARTTRQFIDEAVNGMKSQ